MIWWIGEYIAERIKIKWDEELKWLVDWIFVFFVYSVHIRIYVLFFFFFTVCTLIIFFFRIVRIYVLSLLFFLFTVCTSIFFFFSIVRIYILSLFFVYTSIIFFFYKNLCTFFFVSVYSVHFRIRINVLESILICLESMYFFFLFCLQCAKSMYLK